MRADDLPVVASYEVAFIILPNWQRPVAMAVSLKPGQQQRRRRRLDCLFSLLSFQLRVRSRRRLYRCVVDWAAIGHKRARRRAGS